MTKDIWFISDTHFNHNNCLLWETGSRGDRFSSVEEMNETIIENWNSVVKKGDKVYHLGDVFFGPKDWFSKNWPRLNGSKNLIVGNHDDIKYLSAGGFFKKVYMWRVWDDKPIIFSHVPLNIESLNRRKWDNSEVINVHGHTHEKGSPEGPYRSVCVDVNNYTPVHLEELI